MTSEKEQILRDAGYFYFDARELYANRKSRKVFSLDYIEGNTTEELEKRVQEMTEGNAWVFHLENELTSSQQRELELFLVEGR
jgi:hypothetical protein